MNFLEKCSNSDGYLLAGSYGLSSAALNIPIIPTEAGLIGPLFGSLFAIIPATLISATGTTISLTKLSLQIIGKIAFATAGSLGNTKARSWSNSINISLTARKTGILFLSLLVNTLVGIPTLGFGGHWLNMRLIEQFGIMETSIYLNEKVKKQSTGSTIELNTEDVEKIAERVFIQEGTGMLCAFGFANHAIQAAAQKQFSVTEYHTRENETEPTICKSRKFSPYYKPAYGSGSAEPLCSCGLATSDSYKIFNKSWKGLTADNISKYTWKLEPKSS